VIQKSISEFKKDGVNKKLKEIKTTRVDYAIKNKKGKMLTDKKEITEEFKQFWENIARPSKVTKEQCLEKLKTMNIPMEITEVAAKEYAHAL